MPSVWATTPDDRVFLGLIGPYGNDQAFYLGWGPRQALDGNGPGLDTLQSHSQIIPIVIGDNEKAVMASMKLREQGIIAAAIRPPTVPAGSARLRISITLAHHVDDLERAAAAIIKTVGS